MPRVDEPYDRQDEQDWEALHAFRAAQAEPEPLDPVAVLVSECNSWLSQAAELRQLRIPGVAAPYTSVYEAQVAASAQLSSLEGLLSNAMGFKAACEDSARKLEAAADDAWDDQAAGERQRGTYGRREFEGAQERYAYWRLAVREQRKRAREARSLADTAADTERRIRLHYYGLSSVCDNLSRRLTALTRQMNMEPQ